MTAILTMIIRYDELAFGKMITSTRTRTSQNNMVPNASGADCRNVVSWLLYPKVCKIYDSTGIARKEGTYDLDGVAPFGNKTDI